VPVWLALWQLASMSLAAGLPHGELLLPSPVRVLARLGQLALTASFWTAAGRSAGHILGGFFLAAAAAVLLAALAARFPAAEELLRPAVAAVKTVPVMSFIILALLWLPAENLSVFIAGLMVFPPVYLNLLEGFSRLDPELEEMARLFAVPFRRRLRELYVPQLLPYFRSSCALALGLCWKAGVAAEVIGLPRGTLGERLYSAKVYWETPDLFAWTIAVVGLSVLFERLLLALLDAAAGEGRRVR
jgi:NitT/TauT family transport system permease protein